MPKINISESHNLEKDELNKRVQSYLELLRDDKMKMVEFDFDWASDKESVVLKGKGFKGMVNLEGNTVDIKVDLSMMLSPFKGKVESGLKKGLIKYLA